MAFVIIGIVFGLAIAAFMPLYLLALGKNSRRAITIVVIVFTFMFGMAGLNKFFPNWGDAGTQISDQHGLMMVCATLISGVAWYITLWRFGYLDWVRRWLRGPDTTKNPDDQPG